MAKLANTNVGKYIIACVTFGDVIGRLGFGKLRIQIIEIWII